MKKVLIAAIALMVGASMSLAGLGIQWSNGGGWLVEYKGDVTDGPGVLENNNVIWQLIFAGSDNKANDPDLSATDYLGGDDSLITSRELTVGGGTAADGTEWDTWLMQTNDKAPTYEDLDWKSAGSVYQRVWQGTPTVEDGGKYFETGLFTIDTGYAGGGAAPQEFNLTDGNGYAIDKVIEGSGPGPQPPTPTVPEPATMSLLGLGALAMVLRRKLSK